MTKKQKHIPEYRSHTEISQVEDKNAKKKYLQEKQTDPQSHAQRPSRQGGAR